ncbi:hypothetical protein BN871_BR_00030 [Paenibacillus sp. P22]|nr:hypothetical protein BN871_BR_00030 [Paenibacillus sp. P22]
MAIEVFNRYENKYLMDTKAFYGIYNRLMAYMELDEYNRDDKFYSISNLYYDTEHHSLIRTSLSKPKYREKLRIRAYGVPGSDAKIYLELKKKSVRPREQKKVGDEAERSLRIRPDRLPAGLAARNEPAGDE